MAERIVVTGGTGLLGRRVVERLASTGRHVRVVSRSPRPATAEHDWATADLRSGDGVPEALSDADVIVHCATAFGRVPEMRMATTLVRSIRGTPHLVYVSIVGVDRVPLGYYQGKLAVERLVAQSGLPYTIQRATQFHQMLRAIFAGAARTPVIPVPAFRFQPIDAADVADRVADLAAGEPAGHAPDIAGPRIHTARELAAAYLRVTGQRRLILPMRLPGKTFRAFREGGNLAPDRAVGASTFEDYLAAHPAPSARSYREQS